jgi:RNA polymerase sigma factor (sigma-70 family)
MTMNQSGDGGLDAAAVDAEVLGERRHLTSLAFRMLGTFAEAEDAVQETYARWYRMSQSERDAIDVPRAWLTRVASRVCLDVLDSARARREQYVGPWLPEPLPTRDFIRPEPVDPLDRVTLDDSVSTALLVVLESMTPAERVTFVLHDVFAMPFDDIAEVVGRSSAACRQLATSARRRVSQTRNQQVTKLQHDEVVRAFSAAALSGQLEQLIAVLDPDVVLRADGGGFVTAARRPVSGSDNVGRFLLGVLTKNNGISVSELQTNDGLAFAMWLDGRIVGVVNLGVAGTMISDVWMVMNPEKLLLWN